MFAASIATNVGTPTAWVEMVNPALVAPVGNEKLVGDDTAANGLRLWTDPKELAGAGCGSWDAPLTEPPPTTKVGLREAGNGDVVAHAAFRVVPWSGRSWQPRGHSCTKLQGPGVNVFGPFAQLRSTALSGNAPPQ
jgi:hypothetical protein